MRSTADTAISHTIFFIAAVLISVSVVAVFAAVINDFTNSIEDKSNRLNDEIRTDIQIINDPTGVPFFNDNLTIYVKNTGRTTIVNDSLVVLVDGARVNITNLSTPDGALWHTGITANITISTPSIDIEKDHTLRVIVMHGASDSIIFRVRSLSGMRFHNDPARVPYTNPILTFYLTNTGEMPLNISRLTIMVDGAYRNISSVSVAGGDWDPGEMATIWVNASDLRQDIPHNALAQVGETSDILSNFRIEPRFAFRFVNDPDAVPYNNSNLSFYLQNTGRERIDPSSLTVLLNGTLKDVVNYEVIGGGEWVAGSTLNLTVKAEGLNTTVEYRAQINGPQGATAAMNFHAKDE